MLVYSNSCSFGAATDHPTYSEYFAQHHRAKLVNNGAGGSCNRRIIRTSLRDLGKISKTETDVVALIGLTFISRTELWQTNLPALGNDGHFHPIKIDDSKINWSTSGLINTLVPDIYKLADANVQDYYREWLLHYHPEPAVTELVTDLLMFAGWAQSKNIRYLVFSNVDVFPDSSQVDRCSPFLSSLIEDLSRDASIIDPWTFSFGTYARSLGFRPKDAHLYGMHGHPNQQAHEKFSELLISKFEQVYQAS